MDEKQKDPLYYEKLRTILMGVAVLLLAAILIGGIAAASGVRRYEARVTSIIDRLDRITADLEKLDVENLVRTVNDLNESLDTEKIDEIISSLDEVSRELSEVDWSSMTENISDVAATARDRLSDIEKALDTIGTLDLDSLNEAIQNLQEVIEPLSDFAKRFG